MIKNKIDFIAALDIVAEKQNELQKDMEVVCRQILNIRNWLPIMFEDELFYPGIYAPKYFSKVIEELDLRSYRTPPRRNVYSNIIISGITPGTKESYECHPAYFLRQKSQDGIYHELKNVLKY